MFSTNAPPLEFERSYDAFGCFALEHGGDFKAAPKALAAEGYGTARESQPARSSANGTPADKKIVRKTETETVTKKEPELEWTAEGYAASLTGMKYRRTRKGENTTGDDVISLCNFNARIVAEVIEDDGVETKSCYEIEATLAGETAPRKGTIPASEYSGLKWIADLIGVRAIIFPGKEPHVRCGIKSHSQEAEAKRVVAHLGWRFDGNGPLYYHSGGAIGAAGFVTAEVKLPNDFQAYVFPSPPQGLARIEAINASLRLADLAPGEITIPSLSAPAAAIIGGTDHTHHIVGQSGNHKSCWQALLQNHFGAGFRYDRLPAAWQQGTAISLLTKCHVAKDSILSIDDYKPGATKQETQKLREKAAFVLRAQANRAGRSRP